MSSDDVSAWEKKFLRGLKDVNTDLKDYTGYGFRSSFLDLLAIYVGVNYLAPADPLAALMTGLGPTSKGVLYVFGAVAIKNLLWQYYAKQQAWIPNTIYHGKGYDPRNAGKCTGGKC